MIFPKKFKLTFEILVRTFLKSRYKAVVAPSDHKSKILVVRKIEILVVY